MKVWWVTIERPNGRTTSYRQYAESLESAIRLSEAEHKMIWGSASLTIEGGLLPVSSRLVEELTK